MIAHEVYDITYYKTSQGSVTAVTHFCRYTYHMLSYTSYDSSDSILLPKVGHNWQNIRIDVRFNQSKNVSLEGKPDIQNPSIKHQQF